MVSSPFPLQFFVQTLLYFFDMNLRGLLLPLSQEEGAGRKSSLIPNALVIDQGYPVSTYTAVERSVSYLPKVLPWHACLLVT